MNTRVVWQRQVQQAYDSIPAEWLVTYDGASYINPEYRTHPLVRTYATLMQVGYARGWVEEV